MGSVRAEMGGRACWAALAFLLAGCGQTAPPWRDGDRPRDHGVASTEALWAGEFPTRDTVGLPEGWTPDRTVDGDIRIDVEGTTLSDVRVTDGLIMVNAPGVTLRRIQGIGARVSNEYKEQCGNGLVVEDSEFTPNAPTKDTDPEVIGSGGYTLRNSVIDGYAEGARVSGTSVGCGPVLIENSYIRITSPAVCNDWHGDGIQGYDGNALTVRRSSIFMEQRAGCGGTAPFFYPKNQGNKSVDIDGLLVSGGGYPFRNGMPGSVRNLNIVQNSWVYAPVDVNCPVLTTWQAQIVQLDAKGQPVPVRPVSCAGVE